MIDTYKKALKQIEKDSEEVAKKPQNYKSPRIVKMDSLYEPAALFFPGDFTNKNEGVFKVNIRSYKQLMRSDVRNLTLHEAVPGHSLQLQYTTLDTKIPRWLRMISFTSTVEGWALYAERFIKNPSVLETYSTLNSMQIRAVRLVVDIGIHIHGWSFNQASNFMHKYLYNSDEEIASEVYRYSVLPGQACSYMIGCLVINKMFKESKLPTKKFNTLFLENSFLPLCFVGLNIKTSQNND